MPNINNTTAQQPCAINRNSQFLADAEFRASVYSAWGGFEDEEATRIFEELEVAQDLIDELSVIENIGHRIAMDARDAIERIYHLNGSKEVVREMLAHALANDTFETRSALQAALAEMGCCHAKLPDEVAKGLIKLGMPSTYQRRKVKTYVLAVFAFNQIN